MKYNFLVVLIKTQCGFTEALSVVLLYSNALCQLFLFAVVQQELADVEDFLVSGGLLRSGRLTDPTTTGGKPPRYRKNNKKNRLG